MSVPATAVRQVVLVNLVFDWAKAHMIQSEGGPQNRMSTKGNFRRGSEDPQAGTFRIRRGRGHDEGGFTRTQFHGKILH